MAGAFVTTNALKAALLSPSSPLKRPGMMKLAAKVTVAMRAATIKLVSTALLLSMVRGVSLSLPFQLYLC